MSAPLNSQPLDLLVVEAGERVGASVCAALLAQLGATVFVLESAESEPARDMVCRARVVGETC